jgi:chemotaxis protein MotB
MKHNMINLILVSVCMASLLSCVPLKQYKEMESDASSYKDSNQQLKEENQQFLIKNKELEGKFDQAMLRLVQIQQEMTKLKEENQSMSYKQDKLNQIKDELERQINILKHGSSEEITKLLKELQVLQENLQQREDKVKAAESEIATQKQRLSEAQTELIEQQNKLKSAEKELGAQQAKLKELQDALDRQQKAVTSLKDKVISALTGFNNQGLTVYEKNGKVYVSMEDKLLFKSGSYTLDAKGQDALTKLSDVLASNSNINIMVEGHTDNVPLTGTGALKDNWDLSVMRANAVTKIILANKKIDPKRIISAGRSEYVPLVNENTAEARQKNRRTEIILTPDLSEVFNILQSN